MIVDEDRLQKMEFVPFLKWVKDNIRYLSHRPKTDTAIREATDLARIVCYKLVREYKLTWEEYETDYNTSDFWDAEQILKEYKFKASDKKKAEVISRYTNSIHIEVSMLIAKKDATPPASN